MSNINVTAKGMSRYQAQREKGSSRRKVNRWLKILLTFSIAVVLVFGSLAVTGKFITSEIGTETDPQALGSWGPGTSFIETRSGNVHILDIGEGEVILLIHGSSGSIADWQEHVAYPLAESYRVVAFDSYGFGLSERKDSSEYGHALWEQQAIDVLDALEIDHAVVLGHSAGAMTAVLLAADYPERFRGVILSGHGLSADPAQMLPFLPGVGEFWAARQSIIGDSFSESYKEQAEEVHKIRGTRAAYLAFMRSQYISPTSLRFFKGGYEEIKVSVLQIHGSQDRSQTIESAQGLSSRIANSRFVAIEGSDHHTHIEAPDLWLEAVTSFLESLSP